MFVNLSHAFSFIDTFINRVSWTLSFFKNETKTALFGSDFKKGSSINESINQRKNLLGIMRREKLILETQSEHSSCLISDLFRPCYSKFFDFILDIFKIFGQKNKYFTLFDSSHRNKNIPQNFNTKSINSKKNY